MGMRPEEMERWGAASIFKESGRLLHKHYRLFLPFFLALYLPISIVGVFETLFETMFPSPSFAPLLDTSVVSSAVNTTQITDPPGHQSFTWMLSWTLFFLFYVLGTLGAGAVYCITDYLYSPSDIDDDHSIIPKVIKFLPRAFLRMLVTEFWTVLALILPSGIIGGILCAIVYATAGWWDPILLVLFVLLLLLAGLIFLVIVFALAQVIAVLEPGNYGREALKRSTKLVGNGRAWTIVAVMLTTGIVLPEMWKFSALGIETSGMPMWAKVVLLIAIEGLDSVLRVYFAVVSVVMYFVYKARFDAAGSAGIPVFKRIDLAEPLYDPIVQGKGSVTYVII